MSWRRWIAATRSPRPSAPNAPTWWWPTSTSSRESIRAASGRCPVLLLAHPHRARRLRGLFCPTRTVGILRSDAGPQRVIDGIRRLARREPVLDADLVVAALRSNGPLTSRETQVLTLTAAGAPVAEVAASLGLSRGTVRNHLGRITRKVGARTRVEAVRMAREAGWI